MTTCERAQRAISARMDGEPVDVGRTGDVDRHLDGCDRCRRFATVAERTRAAVRIREADRVPDLVGAIVGRLETAPRPAPRTTPIDATHRAASRRRWLPVAAALIAGAVAGSVLVGGPFRGRDREAVSAEAVVRGVRDASSSIRSFDATYAIVERGYAPDVPLRRMTMRLSFLAPMRFRLVVDDRTVYPSAGHVPNDVTVEEGPTLASVTAPSGCAPSTPSCSPVRTRVTEGGSHALADLIVPMTTFGSTTGMRVEATDTDDGQAAVRVSLSFARAAPMFPFLEMGSWRPIFPGDRVELLLDPATWMPMRMSIFPVSSEARRAWELRFGLPPEPTRTPILDVRTGSIATPAPDRFTLDDRPSLSVGELAGAVGFRPAVPASTGDLELVTVTAWGAAHDRRSLLVFADGLDYLRLGERLGTSSRELGCAADGVPRSASTRFSPADATHGRCLAVVGRRTTVLLESNLPRTELLAIADSLPLDGGAA
jgi:hypothetical protein